MDTAKVIKELRESTGMTRKEFSEHTGIPVRTLVNITRYLRHQKLYILARISRMNLVIRLIPKIQKAPMKRRKQMLYLLLVN